MAFLINNGNSTTTFLISHDKGYMFVSTSGIFHLKPEKQYLGCYMTYVFLKNYPNSINSASLPNFEKHYQNCIHSSFYALQKKRVRALKY